MGIPNVPVPFPAPTPQPPAPTRNFRFRGPHDRWLKTAVVPSTVQKVQKIVFALRPNTGTSVGQKVSKVSNEPTK